MNFIILIFVISSIYQYRKCYKCKYIVYISKSVYIIKKIHVDYTPNKSKIKRLIADIKLPFLYRNI